MFGDPKVEAAFRSFVAQVGLDTPELGAVLQQARDGDLGEEEALQAMFQVVEETPGLLEKFNEMAMQAMAPLRKSAELVKPQTPDGPGLVFDSGVGLPRLNPLYEAALLERAQFDSDIPELRTGPLDRGAKPAVPVDTNARDPVSLGVMLETASEQVALEVEASRQERAQSVEAIAGDTEALKGGALVTTGGTDLIALARGSADSDPPSYRRGAVPSPIRVDRPTGSMLAALTPQERGQKAWAFLSTTQGRKTATKVIWDLVAKVLREAGYTVTSGPGSPAPEVLAYREWTLDLGGPSSTQAAFSLVDVASRVLGKGLLKEIEDSGLQGDLLLETHAINTVDVRSVGWAARLVGSSDGT